MINAMKVLLFLLSTIFIFQYISAQPIQISENLELIKVSENCYMHKQNNNNGLVYLNDNEAVIVSTPESDIETQNLIDYVRNELKANVLGYIIDRWHTDAM